MIKRRRSPKLKRKMFNLRLIRKMSLQKLKKAKVKRKRSLLARKRKEEAKNK